MEQLTLQQLFGANAFEDGQILRINKSDLPGLTPLLNNTAESLFVAIILVALRNFQGVIEDENGIPITEENGIPITFDNQNAFEVLSVINWESYLKKRNNYLYVANQVIVFSYAPN